MHFAFKFVFLFTKIFILCCNYYPIFYSISLSFASIVKFDIQFSNSIQYSYFRGIAEKDRRQIDIWLSQTGIANSNDKICIACTMYSIQSIWQLGKKNMQKKNWKNMWKKYTVCTYSAYCWLLHMANVHSHRWDLWAIELACRRSHIG